MRGSVLGVVLLTLVLADPASAGTIWVTTTFDQVDGAAPCSLREAVTTANQDVNSGGCTDTNSAAADTIRLPGGDYNLTRWIGGAEDGNASGDLDVAGSLTISGLGADVTGIDGNGGLTGDRVLHVVSGTVTVSRLTIHGGAVPPDPLVGGGGIRGNPGTTVKLIDSAVSGNTAEHPGGGISGDAVALARSTVSGNTSSSGGGIYAESATIATSTLSGNTSRRYGGGIYAMTATVTGSTVSGNTAQGGGGITAWSAGTISNTTVSDNIANQDFEGGGGILIGSGTVTGSSVRRNDAAGAGGGIWGFADSLSVTATTVAGNTAGEDGGGILFSTPGTLNVTNSTLSGNLSRGYGGALTANRGTTNLRSVTINRNVGNGGGLARFATATVNLANTILAGNFDATTDPEYHDWFCEGSSGVVSQGYNLLPSVADCAVTAAVGDQTTAAPGLGQLANNGGPTLTHALLAGSPAINTGNPATPGSGGTACSALDQRGVPRTLGGRCDKGAYERVSCQGRLVNRVGTTAAETIVGTAAVDGILGLAGNDVIRGGGGNDGLCGGLGDDTLLGEAGSDALDGGDGSDSCNGGTETDQAIRCETLTSIP